MSPDPFETAVRLAIAGNIIDFGVNSNVEQDTVHDAIMRSLTEPIDRDAVQRLRQAIDEAKDILFLGDNTGEIVFDRLLIERMPREKITYVVRGGPILNDALMEDARDRRSDGPGRGDRQRHRRARHDPGNLLRGLPAAIRAGRL